MYCVINLAARAIVLYGAKGMINADSQQVGLSKSAIEPQYHRV
ncbi:MULTISPECIES: hypothetical protein [unclassified Microcoleus]